MKHLLDFVFLAILVDLLHEPAEKQALKEQAKVTCAFLLSGLVLWFLARLVLRPLNLEPLAALCYIIAAFGVSLVAKVEALLRAAGVWMLLGAPFLQQAGVLELTHYVLALLGAGLGWIAISQVLQSITNELSSEEFPDRCHGLGVKLIVVALFYWALMGFFNISFV